MISELDGGSLIEIERVDADEVTGGNRDTYSAREIPVHLRPEVADCGCSGASGHVVEDTEQVCRSRTIARLTEHDYVFRTGT